MSETTRLHPVTRIRGELRPSAPVEKAVNRFLEKPMEPGTIHLFTTAQATVEQGDQHGRLAPELSRIEREFRARSMAQRIFVLDSPLSLQARPDGSGRLFFNVKEKSKPALTYFRRRLGVIESLEEPGEEDLLYVELARGALAKESGRRRERVVEARDAITAELRHPTAQFRMTASGLHVVTRDMMYPLKDPVALPDTE